MLSDEQLDSFERIADSDSWDQFSCRDAALLIAEVRRLRKIETAARDVVERGHHHMVKLSGHWWTNRDPYHHATLTALAAALQEAEKP